MPDAISAGYNNVGDDARFFALGPIPPGAFLLNLTGLAEASIALRLNLSHVTTIQDTADAAAHAAGRRLCARSATLFNTQPGYTIGLIASATPTWGFALNTSNPSGASWIITYAQCVAGLNTWSILLTVNWLNSNEYERLYGLARPGELVAPKPPGPPPPAAPPAPGPPFGGVPI